MKRIRTDLSVMKELEPKLNKSDISLIVKGVKSAMRINARVDAIPTSKNYHYGEDMESRLYRRESLIYITAHRRMVTRSRVLDLKVCNRLASLCGLGNLFVGEGL